MINSTRVSNSNRLCLLYSRPFQFRRRAHGVSSHEPLNSSSINVQSKRAPRPPRFIKTLNISKLQESGQSVMDLSGIGKPALSFDDPTKPKLTVWFEMNHSTFPADTRGVFYFHRNPTHPPLSASIRFRLCDQISDFAQRQDLQFRLGQPWEVPLICLFSERHKGVRDFLHKEGLVRQGTLDTVERLKFVGQRSFLRHYFLQQPFVVDIARTELMFTFVAEHGVTRVPYRRPFGIDHRYECAFEGWVKARFEVAPSETRTPEETTLVMRCLGHVTPIKQVREGGNNVILVRPKVGELISRKWTLKSGTSVIEPLTFPLWEHLEQKALNKLVSSPEWHWRTESAER
ncbi:hypothetical protein CPB83DRAFT_910965 [Crepidotus variabilis]|uniref:Uncharacterized protein n=1 Tax=Crepidotus variabilis TaxID=179855 RepID=A0A9P6E5Y7_9AGAR|nr:hypothetical protein CPB83DRAFT_910965 [Crepidotus variabilis]